MKMLTLITLLLSAGAAFAEPTAIVGDWSDLNGLPSLRDINGRIVPVSYYHANVRPVSDFCTGFYFDYARIPAQYRNESYYRKCFRQMREYGCSTVTIYGWTGVADVSDLGLQLRLAKEEGLADHPVIILPCGSPADLWPKLKPLVPAGVQIWGYGPDEPAATEQAKEQVAQSAAEWHSIGIPVASAININSARAIGDPLDVWIVNINDIDETARRPDHQLWAYTCDLRGTNRLGHRWLTGIYAYALHRRLGVSGLLLWAYLHDVNSSAANPLMVSEHALCGEWGPIATAGMDGMRDGASDFAVLNELEARGKGADARWLDDLVGKIPLQFWAGGKRPGEDGDYWWNRPDTFTPPLDVETAMLEAAARLVRK